MRMIRRGALIAACSVLAAVPALAQGKHHKAAKPQKLAQAVEAPAATPAEAELAPQPSMTLNDALAIAYETNPQLGAAQAGLRAGDEQAAQANGGWRADDDLRGRDLWRREIFLPRHNG